MTLQSIDNYSCAVAAVELFNRRLHDPSLGEIYAQAIGEENGHLDHEVAAMMRPRIALIKDALAGFGIPVIALSQWYYRPIFREGFESSDENMLPPSFREEKATNGKEAELCLAGPGKKRVPYGLLYSRTKDEAKRSLLQAHLSRDLRASAGHVRGFNDRIAQAFNSGAIDQKEGLDLLRSWSKVATEYPSSTKAAQVQLAFETIGGLLPRMIPAEHTSE